MMSRINLREEKVAQIVANSFKDYHAKGFDYLCLHRDPAMTAKIYIFGDEFDWRAHCGFQPEVVHPHDHRYAFRTSVLSGAVANSVYDEHPFGEFIDEFEYRTPLNGGNGFEWKRWTKLLRVEDRVYFPGGSYFMKHDRLHTIRIVEPGTVLSLIQYEDVVPVGEPTRMFSKDREPPKLDGLYGRFTPDEVIARLGRVPGLEVVVE